MNINRKTIKDVSKILPKIGPNKAFFIGMPVSGNESNLLAIGFAEPIEAGVSIVPTALGKISDFNAKGSVKVHKDRPKELCSRMISSSWKDWHGQYHHGIKSVDYYMFPRTYIEPPQSEIYVVSTDEGLLAISEVMTSGKTEESHITHVINLFLECFKGRCQIYDSTIKPLGSVRKLSWKVLPPGLYPWEKVKAHVAGYLKELPKSEAELIEYRLQVISRYEPDMLAIGSGGFSGYFAFGFLEDNIFILESPSLENATYAFGTDWETFSKLTKKQIINAGLMQHRVIHNKSWHNKIRMILNTKRDLC